MTRLAEIRSAWRSPALGRPGALVEEIADIEQALHIIFTTPRGSDPHRPDFASDLDRLIDRPVTELPGLLAAALIEAADRWEPRVEIVRVPVAIDGAAVTWSVIWKPRDAGAIERRLSGVFPPGGVA